MIGTQGLKFLSGQDVALDDRSGTTLAHGKVQGPAMAPGIPRFSRGKCHEAVMLPFLACRDGDSCCLWLERYTHESGFRCRAVHGAACGLCDRLSSDGSTFAYPRPGGSGTFRSWFFLSTAPHFQQAERRPRGRPRKRLTGSRRFMAQLRCFGAQDRACPCPSQSCIPLNIRPGCAMSVPGPFLRPAAPMRCLSLSPMWKEKWKDAGFMR